MSYAERIRELECNHGHPDMAPEAQTAMWGGFGSAVEFAADIADEADAEISELKAKLKAMEMTKDVWADTSAYQRFKMKEMAANLDLRDNLR